MKLFIIQVIVFLFGKNTTLGVVNVTKESVITREDYIFVTNKMIWIRLI